MSHTLPDLSVLPEDIRARLNILIHMVPSVAHDPKVAEIMIFELAELFPDTVDIDKVHELEDMRGLPHEVDDEVLWNQLNDKIEHWND
jgi:hypothetical protein